MSEISSPKTERLSIRLDPKTKRKIGRAAELSHQSINGFVLDCVGRAAEGVIERSETVSLTARDRDKFWKSLARPPRPRKAMRDAFATHDLLIETDD